MKKIITTASIACLSLCLLSCNDDKETKKQNELTLNNLDDSISYCLGFQSAAEWAQRGVDSLNPDAFKEGLKEFNLDTYIASMQNQNPYIPLNLTEEQFNNLMERYENSLRDKYAAQQEQEVNRLKNEYASVITEGEKFLAENKQQEGVVTTESGLQYKITKQGTGKKPSTTDVVVVNYKGRLLDGTEFDKNDNIEFQLDKVIPGWTEGLQLLSVGSKATLYIPYDLAYGPYGAGNTIPPFATLIFDVELISIK